MFSTHPVRIFKKSRQDCYSAQLKWKEALFLKSPTDPGQVTETDCVRIVISFCLH